MIKSWPFLFYFVFFAALSSLAPYIALYYQSIGLTGAQIGLLTGLGPLITLVAAPLGTGFADATHRHRLVMSLALLAVVVFGLVAPSIRNFELLLLVVSVFMFAQAPIIPLGDNATMTMLGEKRAMFGRIRLGGSLGWGAMALVAGQIIDRNGIAWSFWVYAAGMALALLVAQGLRFGRAEPGGSFRRGMRDLLADRHWVLFLGMAFCAGVGMASINTYQFVYMAEIGASKTLMGLSLALSTLSELPVMFFGNRLLKRFSPQGLLLVGMLTIGVRVLLYAAFNTAGPILALQVLHGLTFPAIWIAGVAYAHEHAPAGLAATGQGLFGATMTGLGAAVGGMAGGLLIGAMGGRGMYVVFGVVVLAAALGLSVVQRLMPASRPEAA
ncbi:MAG: MFS transporter [Bacteroidota bacterium]